jgi:two-component system, OmpR family, sensor histidine kinase SenX3
MHITSRRNTIAFFLTLGVCLAALAFAVGSGWIIVNWREGVKVFLGVIFFGAIITGITLNTIFLVREIRRNEQHDSFINAVTHELKTPITSIRLYLETLQQRQVEDRQRREFYKLMLLDTDRLLGTVEQVLKAGKAGDKRAARHRMEVDFSSLVRECIDLARTRHHLEAEAVRYEETVTGARTRILGDPEELRTAVFNVIDNAIKYSGNEVDVAVQLRVPDEEHLLLRVRDRGVGIAPDDLKQIFKRFYRVPSRALAHVKGTGLGLFIVRAIARKHGGRVFAESEGIGRGTTVSIELPRSVT